MYYIGIDLGGTNIATAIVDENYKVIAKSALPTNAPRDAKLIAADMAKTCFMACDNAGITLDLVEWIGIGSPGSVNPVDGSIGFAGNLGFENTPLAQYIEKATGKTTYIENDANAAAYGELLAGAGRGASDFIAITLGTGVGGGVILGGQIFSGWNHCGGELGHITLIMNGEHCTCGRDGCWEAYASATALIRQTKRAMEADETSKMWEIAPTLDDVNGKTAFDGMRAGDKTATDVCNQYIEYVACGIADIVDIFQPEFICIGGGISKEKDNLRIPIEKYVNEKCFGKQSPNRTKIKIAELGNDAGIIGAAMLGKLHQ